MCAPACSYRKLYQSSTPGLRNVEKVACGEVVVQWLHEVIELAGVRVFLQ